MNAKTSCWVDGKSFHGMRAISSRLLIRTLKTATRPSMLSLAKPISAPSKRLINAIEVQITKRNVSLGKLIDLNDCKRCKVGYR
jgi:hypothetical protein